MTKDINNLKKSFQPLLKKAGVKRGAIFGSYARGDYHKDSDIDLLVDFDYPASLFDLIDLKEGLEKISKRKIDLVTFASISPHLKKRIDKEQVKIF